MYKFYKSPFLRHPTNDAGGTDDKPTDNGEDGESEPDNGEAGGQDDKPAEVLETTQEKLDKIIARAYAKGARAAKKDAAENEAAKGGTPADGKEDSARKTETEANAKLEKATKRLLEGTVKSVAPDIGMSFKGAKAAAAMANFEDCFDEDGDIDDDTVKEVLEAFLGEWPEFGAEKVMPPSYAAGTGSTPMVGHKAPSLRDNQKNLNKHRIIK